MSPTFRSFPRAICRRQFIVFSALCKGYQTVFPLIDLSKNSGTSTARDFPRFSEVRLPFNAAQPQNLSRILRVEGGNPHRNSCIHDACRSLRSADHNRQVEARTVSDHLYSGSVAEASRIHLGFIHDCSPTIRWPFTVKARANIRTASSVTGPLRKRPT